MQYICFLHIGAGKKEERETRRRISLGRRKTRMHGKFVKRRALDTVEINRDMEKISR